MDERRINQSPSQAPSSRLSFDSLTGANWDFTTAQHATPRESVKRMRARSEGPRARSTRVAVMLRYAAYFLATAIGCALTHVFLSGAGTTSYGGSLMWFSATAMFATAAVGTIIFPNNRVEIFEQMRHYVFGFMLFPGTAVAALIWALRDVMAGAATSQDTLASLVTFAIPAVFITTVVLPPIILVKAVAGFYSLHRSRQSDAEMMAIYNRQDPLQR